jgi:hypothetical protein
MTQCAVAKQAFACGTLYALWERIDRGCPVLTSATELSKGNSPTSAILIPAAGYADTFAHVRFAMAVMVSGAAMSQFQASQHASTMAS